MVESKLTTGGRTTIPKSVRLKLNLQPGDRIRYELEDDGVRLKALKPVRRLFGSLSFRGEPKTVEDMEQGIVEGATRG